MDKKNALILVGFILFISMIIILAISFKKKENIYLEKIKEHKSNAPQSVVIENTTFYPINNLMTIIVNDVLEYDTISVMIAPMPSMFRQSTEYNFRAFIIKNKFYDHAYLILLAPDIKSDEMRNILLHEGAHIYQYETGMLRIIDYDKMIYVYGQDTIDARKVKYENRAFENDAYRMESHLQAKLDSILCN